MWRRTVMLGKKLGSHSLRVAEACTGWKTRFVSYFWPFATPTNQLNDNDWQSVTKIIPIKLNFCINCGVTWAHQYFRYQTHHFGDIHLAFTEVGSIWAIRWSIRGMHSERWKYWTGVVAGMLSRCCCLLAILGTAGVQHRLLSLAQDNACFVRTTDWKPQWLSDPI